MQDGYVESCNGRMRAELLRESLFVCLDYARIALAEWRRTSASPDRIPRSDTRPR